MPTELKLPELLRVLTRLKLLLLKRFYQRNLGSAIGLAVLALAMLAMAAIGGGSLIALSHGGGPEFRNTAIMWGAWIITVVWLLSPLSQMDVQRNLDLTGLRLFPLSQSNYTAAVLLDAVLSPIGLFAIPLLIVGCAAFSLHWVELPVVLLSLLLLLAALLALGQALHLTLSRLLSSRRFTDLSIVLGLIIFFGIQSIQFIIRAPQLLNLPPWLLELGAQIKMLAGPLVLWGFPGLAARTVEHFGRGEYGSAGGLFLLLLGQAGYCFYLAGIAARRYYEGELDSGGQTAKAGVSRGGRVRPSMLGPLGGALFHRERVYLWRDPLLKILFMQTLMGALSAMAAFGIIAVSEGVSSMDEALGGRLWRSVTLLLGTMMLSFMESGVLMNKLGIDGPLLTHVLLTPASRLQLLRAKSIFYLSHFALLNLPVALLLGWILHVPAHHSAAAAVLVVLNTIVVDALGSLVSVYFPFTYRRSGRHLRPVPAQPGCAYLFLHGLALQGANLAVFPGTAAVAVFTYYLGWAGLGLGLLVAGAIAAAVHMLALPAAARALSRREPELLAILTRSQD
ncbi:hypothetical protein IT575_09755 [bacterium]|nr:hypothetical protein [bacterium]